MIDFTAFSQGFGNRRKEDRRLRREMAQAFQEFRAQNPYASAQEFQDFIDAYSGGRNYIAGGAPSQDVLRSIASENQKRRARDEMNQRLADLRTRAQTRGAIEGMADDFLLGYEGDDFDKARDEFLSNLGLAGDELGGELNVGSLISQERRDMIAARRAREFLPDAVRLIRDSNGQIDAKTLRRMMPGVPSAAINPLIEQAQAEFEREQEATQMERETVVGQAKNSLLNDLQGDERFQMALRNGNEALARRIIRLRTSNLPTSIQESLGDDWVDSVIQGEVELLRGLQQTQMDQARREAASAGVEAGQAYLESNLGNITSHFGSADEPYPTAGPASGSAIIAASQLAKEFHMDRAALFALEQAFAEADEDISTQEAYELGRNALVAAAQNGLVRTAQQGRKEAQDMARRSTGYTGGVRTFDDYLNTQIERIDQKFAEFEQAASEIAKIEEPEARRQRMQTLRLAWDQYMANALSGARQDEATSRTWLEVGSGGWDSDRITGDNPQSLKGRLASYRQALEERIAQTAAATPPPARPGSTPATSIPQRPEQSSEPSQTKSAAAVAFNRINQSILNANEVKNAQDQIAEAVGMPTSVSSRVSTTIPQIVGNAVNEWIGMTEANKESLNEKQKLASEVMPELTYLLANRPGEYRQQLLSDLRSMSRDKFEQKYMADLQQAATVLRQQRTTPEQPAP